MLDVMSVKDLTGNCFPEAINVMIKSVLSSVVGCPVRPFFLLMTVGGDVVIGGCIITVVK